MTDPAGAHGERKADLTLQWIIAIVASAAVGFVMGLIASIIRDAFELTSPQAGLLAIVFLFVIEIVSAVPSFAVYANRTGAVLRQTLPALPALTWYALHLVAGMALGTVVAIFEVRTGPSPYEPPATSMVISLATASAIFGVLFGAAFGGLQALVLRKAARSVGLWIGWSMLGGTALGLFAFNLYIDSLPNLWSQVLTQGLGFVVAVLAGLALLPAVHRLDAR